jgi:outer membrane protein
MREKAPIILKTASRSMIHRSGPARRAAGEWGICAAAACVLALPGCGSPFASESHRGRQVPAERLRTIDALRLDRREAAPDSGGSEPAVAARSRFDGQSEVPLSIEEARALALSNNLEIKVSLLDPAIAEQRVREEEGRFEAAFTTRALWQETDAPTASQLSSAQQRFQLVEPGVRVPLRTGGTASVSLPVSRTETNNIFSLLNPSYRSDLAFSISHPLLRNAGREVATAPIRIASYNRQASEARTKLDVITQVAAVERAYWRLYQARRDLEVTQQQYELARTQLEKADRLVRAGQVAEIESLRAQSGLADRLDAIIRAQNAVLLQQRELKRIMNAPGLGVGSPTMVIPRTEPAPVEYLVRAGDLADLALANRMELLEIELRLLADAANVRVARNQALPALDLDATYRINGLGGSTRDSFRTLERNNYEDWSIGATLDVPLGNEFARARLRQALLTRLQRLASLDSRRDLVLQEVLNAVDGIQAGWERILATRQASILAGRALRAEQRQFDVGTGTSTSVLDAATRLAEAQLAEIRAITDYQLAQIDLASATGTLLGASRIEWAPAPVADDPGPAESAEAEALMRRLDTINGSAAGRLVPRPASPSALPE